MSARRLVSVIAVALAAAAGGAGALAQDREEVLRVPVTTGGASANILVTVYRPAGDQPSPLLVLNHGSPRDAAARRATPRQRLAAPSAAFVKLGYVVAVPTRRGYGESEGHWAEQYGGCNNPDYYTAGLETARDILAVARALAAQPYVDGARIVIAGQSAGGWGALAAAGERPPGLVAIINFAGGRGSRGPDDVCRQEKLVEAAGRYGARATVPSLWIYSENDLFFGPRLARAMFDAYSRKGAPAQFVAAPPSGSDGHGYFGRDINSWIPTVGRYLHAQGLPGL